MFFLLSMHIQLTPFKGTAHWYWPLSVSCLQEISTPVSITDDTDSGYSVMFSFSIQLFKRAQWHCWFPAVLKTFKGASYLRCHSKCMRCLSFLKQRTSVSNFIVFERSFTTTLFTFLCDFAYPSLPESKHQQPFVSPSLVCRRNGRFWRNIQSAAKALFYCIYWICVRGVSLPRLHPLPLALWGREGKCGRNRRN